MIFQLIPVYLSSLVLTRKVTGKVNLSVLIIARNTMLESQNRAGLDKSPRSKIARPAIRMDYVYFDDPNELTDRLRLLFVERSAANRSHTNEIHSIIEELRESGYLYRKSGLNETVLQCASTCSNVNWETPREPEVFP